MGFMYSKIAIQLYSVRNHMENLAGVKNTFAKLREIVMPLYTGTCFSPTLSQAAKMHDKTIAITRMAKTLLILFLLDFILSLTILIAGH